MGWHVWIHWFVFVLIVVLLWFSGDKLIGEVSRLVVAEACIQALDINFTEGNIYEINSVVVSLQRKFRLTVLQYPRCNAVSLLN